MTQTRNLTLTMCPQRLLLLFVSVFVFSVFGSNARICEDIYIKNSVEAFEELRGCTVILGHLKIALIETAKTHHYQNLAFPELREITGYLFMYRVFGLESIGQLFPNLAAIRGYTLFLDYAVVINSLPDLQEIGLHNLRYIGGGTRLGKCPKLCFVDTLDWTKIGGPLHELHYFDATELDCQSCPKHCNGLCWSQNHCQITKAEECDPDCIRCSESNPAVCDACQSLFLEDGKCVPRCSNNKYGNSATRTCMTKEECTSLVEAKDTWWIFQDECMEKCPVGYEKVSPAEGRCRYCGDHCKKVCHGGEINSRESATRFLNCTYVEYLEITEPPDENLVDELEKNLQKLQEIGCYLLVRKTSHLTSLQFLKNLRIIHGKSPLLQNKYALSMAGNLNLRQLWDWNNFTLEIKQGMIGLYDNPYLCPSQVQRLVEVTGLPQNDVLSDSYPFKIDKDVTYCNLISLNCSIRELTSTTVRLEWNESAEVNDHDQVLEYTVYFVEDPFGNITHHSGGYECMSNQWDLKSTKHGFLYIRNLLPYTQYAFYIQVMTLHSSQTSHSGQTAIDHFTTLPGEPQPPTDITIHSPTHDTLMLTWKHPEKPSGALGHYEITIFQQEENLDFLAEDDYCHHPKVLSVNMVDDADEDTDTPLEEWRNSTNCCKKQKWKEWQANTIVKRSTVDLPLHHLTKQIIKVNSTSYEFKSLHHFSIYILYLMRCNDDFPDCSEVMMIFQRTRPKPHADDIPPGISVFVAEANAYVKWLEPVEPNSVILSYIVEYRKVDLDNSSFTSNCVTRQDYHKANQGFTIENLSPGEYFLRIKAVSLAGPGRSTDVVMLQIFPQLERQVDIPTYILAAVLIYTLVFLGFYLNYRNKKSNYLLSNILQVPFALRTSSDLKNHSYQDQYKLSRTDVDASVDTTDQSNFGVICNGFIKSQNRPCTIKLCQEDSNRHELVEFVKNMDLMKISSYHVVNLLGVVSTGQPPLIVMELMAWGDLKSFLQQSKHSDNPVTAAEMYRMAAEIADGMMYLNSKKIIHPDLAARNCLVSAGHTVKVANFPIAKDIYETDYCKKQNEGVPIRWMAPETLADGALTSSSNVWSYGVVLWELATFAELPYQALSDEEVERFVIGQRVLEPAPGCPDLLYEMMVACWRWKQKNRPGFAELLRQLQSHVRRDFRLVSFYHSKGAKVLRKSRGNKDDELSARAGPSDKKKSVKWTKEEDEIKLLSSDELPQRQKQTLPSSSGYL